MTSTLQSTQTIKNWSGRNLFQKGYQNGKIPVNYLAFLQIDHLFIYEF